MSDRKFGVSSGGSSLIDHYEPHIVTAQDYYPFGMLSRVALPNNNKSYGFGFNGKMNDNEVKGGLGNQQDYGMRIYDGRVGRFLSVDPITKDFPELTPYQFASNTPIQAIDLDGEEKRDYRLTMTDGKPVFKLIKEDNNIHHSFLGIKWTHAYRQDIVHYNNGKQERTYEFTEDNYNLTVGIFNPKGGIDDLEAWKANPEGRFDMIFNSNFELGLERGRQLADYAINARMTAASLKGNAKTFVDSKSDEEITLYRGINQSHKYYKDALKGNATPNQGNATPLEHNTKSTLNSNYTSWTSDREVAVNFALRPFGKGIVLTKTFPVSGTVASPNTKKVNLIQTPGKIVSESEKLVKGKVTGAKVEHVKQ